MKLLRKIAITYTFFMLIMFGIFYYLNSQFAYKQRDLIAYNELLHMVQNDYANGKRVERIEEEYDCHIVLSTEISDTELAELYRNSAFVLDFAPNGEYIGKVAWTDELDQHNDSKRGFFGMSLAMWALLLIGGYVLFFYLHRHFVKPVSNLKNFSQEIAKGNLDEPLPLHKNDLFGSFVEAFDIMREQLKESKKREMEAEKARKELVTELSHDIKTPVAVIKATCEVLDVKAMQVSTTVGETPAVATIPNSEIRDKVATISGKADTISQLVSNMMHANLEDLEQLEVSATEENSRILADMFNNIKHYGTIILDNEIPGLLVYMDRLRLEQAVDNVIGNSYKYAGTDVHVSFDVIKVDMPEAAEEGSRNGGVAGKAGAPGVAGAGAIGSLKKVEFLRIRIKDSGPGVSEEDLPLISEKYYRGNNAKNVAGSGLGFYLVKYYMERMKGGMEYYNDHGFVVELLLRKV